MEFERVFTLREDGSTDDAPDLAAAHAAARPGDLIGMDRGGFTAWEAVFENAMPPAFGPRDYVTQPYGWRPGLPPYRP